MIYSGRIAFAISFVLAGFLSEAPASDVEKTRRVEMHETESGVQFGSWGNLPTTPSPTLIVLASTLDGTLGDAYFRQCGNELSANGYLLVSIDLPCHGKQHG